MAAPVQQNSDERWTPADRVFMQRALELAGQAMREGEIPVGAVIVEQGRLIGEGRNQSIAANDPTAHAEMLALRQGAAQMKNYRLKGTTLYVSLEPCVMCAGAIVAARVDRLVFAARDLRFGGVRSKFQLADSDLLNHRVEVHEGLMAAEAGERLAEFFSRAARKVTRYQCAGAAMAARAWLAISSGSAA